MPQTQHLGSPDFVRVFVGNYPGVAALEIDRPRVGNDRSKIGVDDT